MSNQERTDMDFYEIMIEEASRDSLLRDAVVISLGGEGDTEWVEEFIHDEGYERHLAEQYGLTNPDLSLEAYRRCLKREREARLNK